MMMMPLNLFAQCVVKTYFGTEIKMMFDNDEILFVEFEFWITEFTTLYTGDFLRFQKYQKT